MFADDKQRRDWLDGLKAGDEVIIECRTHGIRKEKVLKRTPTKVIVTSWVVGELRFDRFGSEKASDPWHCRSLRPVTQGELDKIETQTLLRRIAGVKWNALPLRNLRAVMEVVTSLV